MKSIFVSSTFKDMQAERDLLNLEVFPLIRDFLLDYFEGLNFIDLRWGVNTEDQSVEESALKVLQN